MTDTNLAKLSTTTILARMSALETASRYSRDDRHYAEWDRLRKELDSRPTDAVLDELS